MKKLIRWFQRLFRRGPPRIKGRRVSRSCTKSSAWRIQSARRALDTLREIDRDESRWKYIRKIDPYIFEEMLLTAFQERGYAIRRNAAYSGDGGIDGMVEMGKRWAFIQAKRLGKKGYVSRADVVRLSVTARDANALGVFIHSGRSSRKTKKVAKSLGVKIIEGKALVALLTGAEFLMV